MAWLQVTVLSMLTLATMVSFVALSEVRVRRSDFEAQDVLRWRPENPDVKSIDALLQINNELKARLRASMSDGATLRALLAAGGRRK